MPPPRGRKTFFSGLIEASSLFRVGDVTVAA
jgi:hypothetical protein